MQLSDYRCPITANCPITLSDYSFPDYLEQNTALYAPITFEEIVIVMIKPKIFYIKHRASQLRRSVISDLFRGSILFLDDQS